MTPSLPKCRALVEATFFRIFNQVRDICRFYLSSLSHPPLSPFRSAWPVIPGRSELQQTEERDLITQVIYRIIRSNFSGGLDSIAQSFYTVDRACDTM